MLSKEKMEQIEKFAIDSPDDAESELLDSDIRVDKEGVNYLRFLLEKLRGKDNRSVSDDVRDEYRGILKQKQNTIKQESTQEVIGPTEEHSVHDERLEGLGTQQSSNSSDV